MSFKNFLTRNFFDFEIFLNVAKKSKLKTEYRILNLEFSPAVMGQIVAMINLILGDLYFGIQGCQLKLGGRNNSADFQFV
jgi:hypothetical protein